MLFESFVMAFSSLKSNKMRSLLTMLGIIIGVGAVIAMVSLGLGVRDEVKNSIAGLGSNLIIVQPGARQTPGSRPDPGSSRSLEMKDVRAIERDAKGVAAVSPMYSLRDQIVAGNQNTISTITGATPEFLTVRNHAVKDGVFFSQKDVDQRKRVVVLGPTVMKNLFGEGNSPVGKTVRIKNAPFYVIGVLEEKGQSMGGGDQDDLVVVPLTTAQERLSSVTHLSAIFVEAENEEVIDSTMDEITEVMRRSHRITGSKKEDFSIMSLKSIIETASQATQSITLLLGSIAAISLLVGGIGIMNIMLVSVTERTREIGIRKALGARYNDILSQFLIESISISVTGGIVGILVGLGLAYSIGMLFQITVSFSVWPIILSFSFSVFVGLFFGIYPARKAALLHPIDALRYE